MANPKNDPLLLEIQEEINREKLNKFINSYGTQLIIAAIVIILGIGGFEAWKQHRDNGRGIAGSQVYKVMSSTDKSQDEFALKTLEQTAKTSAQYYGISLLNKAQIQIKNGDSAGAIVTYDAVANNSGTDKALRDLASLNAANLLLNTNPKADGLEKRISALTSDDNSFKYSARELLAAYYTQNGQQQKANEILQKLANDANTPVSISKRAREFLPANMKKSLEASQPENSAQPQQPAKDQVKDQEPQQNDE